MEGTPTEVAAPPVATLTLEEAAATAVRLLHERRLPQAEALLQAVVDADADNADAFHFLGVLRAQQGRGDDAVRLILRALELAPEYADAWNNLGLLLLAMPRYAAALDAFDKAVEYGPHLLQAHMSRARLLRGAGRFEEAAAAFRRALEIDPALAEAHESLGMVFQRMRRFDDAAEVYANWHRIDPDNPVAAHLAAAYRGGVVPSRASDDYVRATYARFAPGFDRNMEALRYRAPQLIAARLAVCCAAERNLDVLDAGCGTGLCGLELARYARRLVGVDLSAAMVERARERGVYDELIVAELTAYLVSEPVKYDLIVSADTLVYFGAIDRVIDAAAGALRGGGHLAFTVERLEPETPGAESAREVFLNPHGRYSHGEAYVRRCVADARLELVGVDGQTLRLENDLPVAGLVVVAAKPYEQSSPDMVGMSA
ncbi:MAG TPA: tetratricopeptide repeat protein [Tepidisphaeraceae bacterium]|jgi:predicted TPR repeat methyltransferase